MVDRWGHAPQMRHDSGNLRRLEQIPAEACPGLDAGLRDFADKDLLQHIESTIMFMTFDGSVKSHRDLDILPRLCQFRLADIERHFLNFN
jgi:hypothetical protein